MHHPEQESTGTQENLIKNIPLHERSLHPKEGCIFDPPTENEVTGTWGGDSFVILYHPELKNGPKYSGSWTMQDGTEVLMSLHDAEHLWGRAHTTPQGNMQLH